MPKRNIPRGRSSILSPREREVRHKVIQTRWARNNRDRTRRASRLFSLRHPERDRASARRWRAENPEAFKAQNRLDAARRRAREMNARIGDLDAILRWESEWRSKERVNCEWCGGELFIEDVQVDHIIAISRGGAQELDNLCISCQRCNGRKWAKGVHDFVKILFGREILFCSHDRSIFALLPARRLSGSFSGARGTSLDQIGPQTLPATLLLAQPTRREYGRYPAPGWLQPAQK